MSEDSPDADGSELADAVFRVLSDDHRRFALYYLRERDSATVEELATVLTGWLQAREDAIEMARPDDRESVLIELYHVHLPRMADEGFVRYDYDSGEVALGTVPELLETVLERSLVQERHMGEGHASEDGPESGTDRCNSEDP